MTDFLRDRFQKSPDRLALAYGASISFDRRLYRQDIAGSVAHARMLGKQGIISDNEAELIIMGLISIRQEIEEGKFVFKPELEDIHMNIEARLSEKIGELAGKLHTARSRNDQVALDMRLFVKEAAANTIEALKGLQKTLLDQAQSHKMVIMPGYTHLQRAQPVILAHYLLAYFEMFQRDRERFNDCLKRVDVMPLGSGAIAGVPYALDREYVAGQLGFSGISQNSMDAVSDRDFVVEFHACASIGMMHLSRLAEEFVLWSTPEFGFIVIDDAFATTSSIMPQKKNPDIAELARGKTGRVYGNLMAMLTVLKGLPLTYNRDLQEDKEGLFDTVDTLELSLEVVTAMLKTIKVNSERMRSALESDYILATDLADYLVRKGAPFRKAHSAVAGLVAYASEQSKTFGKLSLDEYQKFSPLFASDVYQISVENSVAARKVIGGTSPQQVEDALARAEQRLEEK